MSTDYQHHLKGDVLQADAEGNAAAASFETVTAQHGNRWGLLPGMSIPLDFALERQQFFRGEFERTKRDGPKQAFIDSENIKSTEAFSTQQAMLHNYTDDMMRLPQANQAYDSVVPLANMAATAVAKLAQLSSHFGINLKQRSADRLDSKHVAALHTGVVGTQFHEGDSIASRGRALYAARQQLASAAAGMRAAADHDVITQLTQKAAATEHEQQEINKKIARVQKLCGYVEKSVSMLGGAAGKLAAASVATEESSSIRDSSAAQVAKGAEKTAGRVGLLGNAAGAVMGLYYAEQLHDLNAHVESLQELASAHHQSQSENKTVQAAKAMEHATAAYQSAVLAYEAAINDRRRDMAHAGAVADKAAPTRRDQQGSSAMLWMGNVLEANSSMTVAWEAAREAQATMAGVGHSVAAHRRAGWSQLEDTFNLLARPRSENERFGPGPDERALAAMRRFIDNWLKQGQPIRIGLGNAASAEGESLTQAGYSGEY